MVKGVSLQKISPTNNVDKINVPLLVVQGANDPRVPASEAAQIVKAVRAKGKEAWYLLAKDEGHGFAKKKNRDRLEVARTAGRVSVLLESNVRSISEKSVELEQAGNGIEIPNDAVIVNAGGILPTGFLKEIGIEVETKYGTA